MWRWFAARPWVTSLVLVALVAGGAALTWRYEQAARDDFSACVARWADNTSARSAELGRGRAELDGANDALWRAMAAMLAAPPPDARAQFQELLDVYVAASDRFRANVADHPIPVPPRLGC